MIFNSPDPLSLANAKIIPGFRGYLATEDGNIISLHRAAPHVLSPHKNPDGYRKITACGKCVKVAVLVCLAFHGLRPQGNMVRHMDGSRDNDRPENLKWGTASENSLDAVRHGTCTGPVNGRNSSHKIRGEGHGMVKLTWPIVRQIRARRRAGEKLSSLSEEFGVREAAISKIALNQTWVEACALSQSHSQTERGEA